MIPAKDLEQQSYFLKFQPPSPTDLSPDSSIIMTSKVSQSIVQRKVGVVTAEAARDLPLPPTSVEDDPILVASLSDST